MDLGIYIDEYTKRIGSAKNAKDSTPIDRYLGINRVCSDDDDGDQSNKIDFLSY